MSTSPARRPAGTPAGGQFTPTSHAESTAGLLDHAASSAVARTDIELEVLHKGFSAQIAEHNRRLAELSRTAERVVAAEIAHRWPEATHAELYGRPRESGEFGVTLERVYAGERVVFDYDAEDADPDDQDFSAYLEYGEASWFDEVGWEDTTRLDLHSGAATKPDIRRNMYGTRIEDPSIRAPDPAGK